MVNVAHDFGTKRAHKQALTRLRLVSLD